MGIKDMAYPETNNLFKGSFLYCLLMVCFSCTKPVYYEKYQTVENPWPKNSEYFFTCDIEDLTPSYDISIVIRNNNFYPYQNLWLFYAEKQPGGTIVHDTIECMLADDHGKWIGSGISIYHLSIPAKTRYSFPQKGQYTFTIRQGMREDLLKGIEQIGIRIEKQ
ncbi:MAG: gliding motility lipoprotein GldH [Tannerella sp.]|jgi:gliding motility-associated lipoprotein GldH|nr:gliding motility lipoprotein GldH [Tannerella sp.]